jgi:AraC-like DNA-binding protein
MATILNNCLFFNEPPDDPDDGTDEDEDDDDPSDDDDTDDDGGDISDPDDPDDPEDEDDCTGDPCTGNDGGGGGPGGPSPPQGELIWVCREEITSAIVSGCIDLSAVPSSVNLSSILSSVSGGGSGAGSACTSGQLFTSGVVSRPGWRCVQIPPEDLKATDRGPYASQQECEDDCKKVWVCREVEIECLTASGCIPDATVTICIYIWIGDVQQGDQIYQSQADCERECGGRLRFPEPGGGGPGPGTGGPGGPGPGTGGPGNPTTPCPNRTAYYCVSAPTPPATQSFCQDVGVWQYPDCYCILRQIRMCVGVTEIGFRDSGGNCQFGPHTPPPNAIYFAGYGPSGLEACQRECKNVYDIDCPDDAPPIRYRCEWEQQVYQGTVWFIRRCVSGTNPNLPYASLEDCLEECPQTSTTDVESEYSIATGEGGGESEGAYENLTVGDPNSGASFLDPTYFVPPTNTIYFEERASTGEGGQIFKFFQESSVNALLNPRNYSFKNLNRAIARLNSNYVRNSIRSSISNILYNLKTPDERKYSDQKITNLIKTRLLDGTTTKIDYGYILSLAVRTILTNSNISSQDFSRFVNAQYGVSPDQIANTRQENLAKLELLHAQNSTSQVKYSPSPNQNIAVEIALRKLRALDPRRRRGVFREFMKLWYVLPEDIYAKLPIEEQSGNFYKEKIPNSELLSVQLNTGSSVTVNLHEYTYGANVQTPQNFEIALPETQIHRAFTLKNADHQAAMFHLRSKYSCQLRVTSPSANNLELNYSLSTPLQSHYVLQIDKPSIQDIEFYNNPLVRKTKAKYTLLSDPSAIQDAIQFRVYPWKVLPVNYNDPILGHLTTSSDIEIIYNNMSFEQFGDDLNGPILVRRIPKVVVIIPTDRFDYLFFNGKSKLVDWNKRVLKFSLSQDKNYYNPGMRTNWVKLKYAYPNTDIQDQVNNTGLRAEYDSSSRLFTDAYIDGEQPQRTEDPIRALVRITTELKNTYNINNGLTWKDLYSRITPLQYSAIRRGVPDYMINKLRNGDKTGVKLYHTKGLSGTSTTRLISLKDGQSDNLPIYIDNLDE